MGLGDWLKRLFKENPMDPDFPGYSWNERPPSAKPPAQHRPAVAPETPAVIYVSPAALRLRALLDEPGPVKASISFDQPPGGIETDRLIAGYAKPAFQPPIHFTPEPRAADAVDRQAKPAPRVSSATCPRCFGNVTVWQTFSDGKIRCLACAQNPKRGPQHVIG